MNMTLRVSSLATVLLLAAAPALAQVAGGPVPKPNVFDDGNRWLITGFYDNSPVHQQAATQGICFYPYAVVGTHIRGRWVSDTFPDWNGIYTQEGDQVTMHGDYDHDKGHDGMSWEIVSDSRDNHGAGHWFEWREDGGFGTTIGFGNAHLVRVGKCEPNHIEELGVAPRYRKDGKVAEMPMDPEQLPLE